MTAVPISLSSFPDQKSSCFALIPSSKVQVNIFLRITGGSVLLESAAHRTEAVNLVGLCGQNRVRNCHAA
ncbi:hypothetical protein [Paraburkholderia sp. BR13444]|uniref:hypothetical protein n=1 Tax=Paraburkholderia sp. BR13444 TaxID=3236997 RepID=UPI0034CE5C0C